VEQQQQQQQQLAARSLRSPKESGWLA